MTSKRLAPEWVEEILKEQSWTTEIALRSHLNALEEEVRIANEDQIFHKINEAELRAENEKLRARTCSHGDYKMLGTDGCEDCETGRTEIYYLYRKCMTCRRKAHAVEQSL